MCDQPQNDRAQLALELDNLRLEQIARLQRECAFWRRHCELLTAVADLVSRKLKQLIERGPRAGDFRPGPRPRRRRGWNWQI